MVGADSIGSTRSQPQKRAFFCDRYPAFLHPNHIREGMSAAHLEEHARVYLLTEFGHDLRTKVCHKCLRIPRPHSPNGAVSGNALRLKPISNEDQATNA
jgi:hypothetical protein